MKYSIVIIISFIVAYGLGLLTGSWLSQTNQAIEFNESQRTEATNHSWGNKEGGQSTNAMSMVVTLNAPPSPAQKITPSLHAVADDVNSFASVGYNENNYDENDHSGSDYGEEYYRILNAIDDLANTNQSEKIASFLGHPNHRVRGAAITALGDIDNDTSLLVLSQVLFTETHPANKKQAIAILSLRQDLAFVPTILQAINRIETDSSVKHMISEALL